MKKHSTLAAFCNQIQLILNLPAGFYIVKLVDVYGKLSTTKISVL